MKKKQLIFIIFFMIIGVFLCTNSSEAAVDLDRILDYKVTVDPRMSDGSLDITYEITWKVLDSVLEGPLSWVKIGTPNSYFDSETALSNNIKSIQPYSGSYLRIDFNKSYYEGDVFTFKYSVHQNSMHKVSFGKCKYEFTPAWFTDINVDNITVRWNRDKVKSSNSNSTEDNYLTWTKTNMNKGEKLTVKVKYDKAAFSYLSANSKGQDKSYGANYGETIIVLIFIVYVVIIIVFGSHGGGGYYGHRGFYGGGHRHYHSSCACACAHSSCAHSSCACACAGSGRAGCSKKDFYGTNLTSKKIKKVLDNKKKV